ncbi:MAG: hypothetical protein AB2652_20710 [Candidatus Thiodiazotropha endolucinida]
MSADTTQEIIYKIHGNEFDVKQLLDLLNDDRGIIRANVLFALPSKFGESDDLIVTALTSAATNDFSLFKLMGDITQKKLSIATLSWMDSDVAKNAYRYLIENCDSVEVEDIERLSQHGPIQV